MKNKCELIVECCNCQKDYDIDWVIEDYNNEGIYLCDDCNGKKLSICECGSIESTIFLERVGYCKGCRGDYDYEYPITNNETMKI